MERKDEINSYKHIRHLVHTYTKHITSITIIHMSQKDEMCIFFHGQAVH